MERLKRLVLPTLLGLAGYYAIFGGEYSVFEVRRARAAQEQEAAALQQIRSELDSLRLLADSLENDPATLERLAREQYGMVRDGEVLYRFVEPGEADEEGEDAGR